MTKKVIIFTDSTCDLSKEILDKYNIHQMPLHVTFNETTYNDDDSIRGKKLFDLVEESGKLPQTAGITPDQAIEAFKPFVDSGCEIFYIGLASSMSTTFNSIRLAAEELGKINVFYLDSMNLSTGIGLLLLKACKYRDEGLSAKEIKEKLSLIVPRVKTQFVVKTFEYLYKGGRIKAATNFIGNTLRIRPMIVVRNGKMKVGKINIGLMNKAVNKMINIFLKDVKFAETEYLFITYNHGSENSLEQIKTAISENDINTKFKNIFYTEAGAVISSHCGPGSIGIIYIMKDTLHDEDLDEE